MISLCYHLSSITIMPSSPQKGAMSCCCFSFWILAECFAPFSRHRCLSITNSKTSDSGGPTLRRSMAPHGSTSLQDLHIHQVHHLVSWIYFERNQSAKFCWHVSMNPPKSKMPDGTCEFGEFNKKCPQNLAGWLLSKKSMMEVPFTKTWIFD